MGSLPMLSILIFLPAVAALLISFVPSEQQGLVKGGALVAALADLALSLAVLAGFTPGPGLAFVEAHAWIPGIGAWYRLGVDGLALSMIVLTGLITPLAILGSWHAVHKQLKGFFIALLLLESGMMGVFCAADMLLFYVFWEVMLIPMALLIGIWGGPRRVYASVKFVLYTMAGSLLMFIGIVYSWLTISQAQGVAADRVFEIATWQQTLPLLVDPSIQAWLFAAFAISFAIKVPMFPVHTWLPDAHVEAPTAGSVILAGVLLKMGSYGFLRFAIPFFPAAAAEHAGLLVWISVIGIVYGSFMAMAQDDIKKLIAYSSVAHLGFVMAGIFSGTVEGAQGGVLQMVNHGISTGALFLLVGVIYERAHTRGVKDFGGLARIMPTYATIFLIVTLSSIGLPGTNGFVGEFLILLGTFQTYPAAAVTGALGVVLGAVYMLTLYRNVFFGKPAREEWTSLPDMTPLELATLAPLLILIFALGLLPTPLLQLTEAPVTQVVTGLNPLFNLTL
ncbi:MAG TPA: NADH-quinone oxidoreductase subunit M [Myxococcota bacterium]|nr:NADH-quinone oxidoreductase subunit M [Myxococcota bacterium]